MKHLLDQKELLTQLEIPDFVLKTQLQIHKDFSVQGLTIDDILTQKELNYSDILTIVENALDQVLRMGERHLLQLNYQVDIPQNQFLSAITGKDPVTTLAELIIRREAFKVYLRTKF